MNSLIDVCKISDTSLIVRIIIHKFLIGISRLHFYYLINMYEHFPKKIQIHLVLNNISKKSSMVKQKRLFISKHFNNGNYLFLPNTIRLYS